ncbi:MAG: hypothetical protein Q8904_08645 [Bacteroidota bacterium]|nr:hypothetical protein [Bacteroidota bacterium]
MKTKRSFAKLLTMMFLVQLSILPLLCQSSARIDCAKRYQSEFKKHLDPHYIHSDTTELLAFIVSPEIDPNSSFRMIKVGDKSYLQVIFLDKNVWVELFPLLSDSLRNRSINIRRETFQVLISEAFQQKMVQTFMKVVEYQNKNVDNKSIRIYDGINYDFIAYLNGKELNATVQDMDEEQSYYCVVTYGRSIPEIVETNLRLMSDIKNHSFTEAKYTIYQ